MHSPLLSCLRAESSECHPWFRHCLPTPAHSARSFAPCRVMCQTPSWHLDFLACLNWLQMPSLIVLRMQRFWCQLFPSLTWAGQSSDLGATTPCIHNGYFHSGILLDSCLPSFPPLTFYHPFSHPVFHIPAQESLWPRNTRAGLRAWHVPQTLASAFCMPQRILLCCFNGKSCSSEPQIHSSVRAVAGGIRR